MTQAKKKGLFAFLLALLASAIVSGALLLSPATVNAAAGESEGSVITVNSGEIADLQTALVQAQPGDTVRLTQNITLDLTAYDPDLMGDEDINGHMVIGSKAELGDYGVNDGVILDLAGHTLAINTNSYYTCLLIQGVDFTVTDSVGGGRLAGTSNGVFATADASSEITLENVTVEYTYGTEGYFAGQTSDKAAIVTDGALTLDKVDFALAGVSNTATTSSGEAVEGAVESVAKVGDTYYTDVKTAIESATEGQTVTLTANATLSGVTYVRAEDVTLDLGNRTLTIPENFQDKLYDDQGEEKGAGVAIMVYGSLTLVGGENGRIDAKGAADSINPFAAQRGGTITVESGTIEVDTNSEACIFAFQGGKVIINGGTLINRATGDYTWGGEDVLVVNAASNATTPANTMVQVNGGTFIGRNPAFGDDAIGGTFITEEVKTVTYTLDGQTYIMVYDAETEPSLPEGADPIGGDYFEGETLVNEVNSAAALSSVLGNVADEAYIRLGASFEADVVIPEGKTVTLDLNGKTLTNVNDHTILNYGTLTVKGEGVVDNVTHARGALFNLGTATLLGGDYTRSKEDSKTNSWYAIKNLGHLTIGAEGEECSVQVIQDGNFSSLLTNGYYDADGKAGGDYDTYSGLVTTDDKLPTLTINGGTFRGGINTVKNDNHSVAEINGGEFLNTTQATVLNWNELTITGGTFNADGKAPYAVVTSYDSTGFNNGSTVIKGGEFGGAIIADYGAANVHYAISGGEFTIAVNVNYLGEGASLYTDGEGGYAVAPANEAPEGMNKVAVLMDGEGYATIAEAIAAAQGDEIELTLYDDLVENVVIPAGKTVVLDLAGKTITNNGDHTITNYGTLTIQGEGVVDNVTHQKGALFNLGTAMLLGGEYTRSLENSSTNSWYAIKNLGHLTIGAEGEECSVQVIQDGNFSSLLTNGYYDADGKAGGDYDTYSGLVTTDDKLPTLTINGGTFRGGINTVKNDNHSVAEINGGEFLNTTQATVLNWNELTINGGTFNSDGTAPYAVVTSYDSTGFNDGITNIAGGKFTGAIIADYGAANVHYAISGGEFSNMPRAAYFEEGYVAVCDDGIYKVTKGTFAIEVGEYKFVGNDLRQAILFAKDGETVKLLGDIKTTMTSATVKSEITIDLNGKTITAAIDMLFILNLKAEKDITIKNGSLSGKAINVVAAADDVHINISGITVKRLNDKYPEESDNPYKGVTPPVLVIGSASAGYITNATLEDVHVNVYVDGPANSRKKAVEIYNANVTIKDSYIFADSKEGITINGVAIENSDVTVTGSEIISTTGSAMGFLGALRFEDAVAGDAENFNTLTVENSMLTGYTIALSGDGGEGNSGTVINVIDSQLNSTGKIGPAIYHPQYGIINISGDKTVLKGSSGIEIRAGIANISGGEFTANAETFSAVASGNGTTTDGAAVAVVQHTTKLPVQVNITGGTFNTETESGKTLYQADLQNNGEEAVAKIAMDVSGGEFNGAVESKNVKGFITGGRFAELPAEDAFAEGLAGELYDGYYMVVNAEDVNAAASIADRLSAQSDLRAYLASFGLTITDMQLVAESDELAADIVAAYDEIFAASTKEGVAEALAAAMDAVDAYKLGLDIEKAAALTELTEYAMGAQGGDLAIVVVPTYAISAINAAVTADEVKTYVDAAKAEMDDIRAQRAEAEQQYQAVNDRFDAIMQALGITGSAEEGYTSEVLDKLNGVIEALGITEADGAWSTDLLDGITQDLETANENIAAMQELLGTAADEATAQTIIGMIKATQNSVASAETNITRLISELSSDISGRFTTLTDAVNALPTNETVEALTERLAALEGTVSGLDTTVGDLGTDIGELETAVAGLTTAQDELTQAINGYKTAVDGILTDMSGKFEEISAKLDDLPTGDELATALTNALSGVTEQLTAIKAEVDKIDGLDEAVIGGVSSAITEAFASFTQTFNTAMSGINTKLDDLGSAVAALPDDADITALKEAVQAATDAAKEAGTKVDTLGTTLSGRFDSVDSAITSIDDAIDRLTAAQNAMNEAMTAFRSELNTTLSGVNKAIAAVKADVKALADTAAADKLELLEKLNALQTSADAIEQAIASLDGDSSADLSAISAELAALQTSLGDVADVVDEVALGNTNSSSSFAGIYVYLSAILVLAAVILIVLAVKKRR